MCSTWGIFDAPQTGARFLHARIRTCAGRVSWVHHTSGERRSGAERVAGRGVCPGSRAEVRQILGVGCDAGGGREAGRRRHIAHQMGVSVVEDSDFLGERELGDIEDRVNSATSGPWFVRQLNDREFMTLVAVSTVPGSDSDGSVNELESGRNIALTLVQDPQYAAVSDELWDENANFIAHARQDVPRLIAEVRRLRSLLGSGRD
jgi:hypothetical protein